MKCCHETSEISCVLHPFNTFRITHYSLFFHWIFNVISIPKSDDFLLKYWGYIFRISIKFLALTIAPHLNLLFQRQRSVALWISSMTMPIMSLSVKLKPATRLSMPRPRTFLPFSGSRGREARLAQGRGRFGLRARSRVGRVVCHTGHCVRIFGIDGKKYFACWVGGRDVAVGEGVGVKSDDDK